MFTVKRVHVAFLMLFLLALAAFGQLYVSGNNPLSTSLGGTNTSTAPAAGRYLKGDGTNWGISTGSASGTGSPTSCSSQAVTAFTLSSDAAPTSTCSSITQAYVDATVNGYASAGAGLTNPVAATDTKLAEISLAAGYLNVANKALNVNSHVVVATGTTQTPTYTLKVKLCTVSGCGSGTALTLMTFGATGAMTASTTVHAEMQANILTTTTGATGVVESSGSGILNITNASGTGGVLWNDINNAGSSTIDLTAALFLDIVGQVSTQSGTKNSMQARLTTVKPVD